jgi:hypothetical protein
MTHELHCPLAIAEAAPLAELAAEQARQEQERQAAAAAGFLDLFVAFATLSSWGRRVYKAFASSYKNVYKAPRPGSRRSRSIRRAPIRATCHRLTLIAPRSTASAKGPART